MNNLCIKLNLLFLLYIGLQIHNKCKYCNEVIGSIRNDNSNVNYNKHVRSCRLYSKFSTKTSTGFDCVFCQKFFPEKQRYGLFAHIRNIHKNEETFMKHKKEMSNLDENEENSNQKTSSEISGDDQSSGKSKFYH